MRWNSEMTGSCINYAHGIIKVCEINCEGKGVSTVIFHSKLNLRCSNLLSIGNHWWICRCLETWCSWRSIASLDGDHFFQKAYLNLILGTYLKTLILSKLIKWPWHDQKTTFEFHEELELPFILCIVLLEFM